MKDNKNKEEGYPLVPTDRILKNFRQLSHQNDSISQMASWLSFYRSSGEQVCSLFGEAFVDKNLKEEERLAIFYVFHEMVTRIITIDEESRKFFMVGYEQFLLTAAPIISRLTFEQRSPYLQVVRIWQTYQRFPQNICERLRLLFNSSSGNQENQKNPSLLDKRDKKVTLDLIKSMNRIKEGYDLAITAGRNKVNLLLGQVVEEDKEKTLKQCIEQYKESLDKITDASILLSQCLQDELKSFDDIKKLLEGLPNKEEDEG
ncbi:hypothetical protein HWI79_3067 [Cryptosporidium felis]|nr:hypothetical protein HWI79_3067 [Cryptosporidium felis]